MAALATMLVRYRRFRAHPDLRAARLARPAGLRRSASACPLTAGVASRLLLHYDAADLTLEGAFLAGLIAGPYAGAIVGRHDRPAGAGRRRVRRAALRRRLRLRRRRPARGLPEGSHLAASRPSCSPSLPPPRLAHACASFEVDWQVMLLLAPIGLELLRQALGARFGEPRLFHLAGPIAVADRRSSYVATVLTRGDARSRSGTTRASSTGSQEQEKLLLAAQDRGAHEPDQPALPVQHADVDLVADPLAARDGAHAHPSSSRACSAGCCSSQEHFVTLREELDADRRVPRHRGASASGRSSRVEEGRSTPTRSTSSCPA